jgi:hypothetical protein
MGHCAHQYDLVSYRRLAGERDFEVYFTGGVVVAVSLSGIATLQ